MLSTALLGLFSCEETRGQALPEGKTLEPSPNSPKSLPRPPLS